MKKEKRLIYNELLSECGAPLCLACRYSEFKGVGSLCDGGEGYWICKHPVENLSYIEKHEEDMPPDTDCYGFSPKVKLETLTEFTSILLINNVPEWAVHLGINSFELDTIDREDDNVKYIRYRYNLPVLEVVK
jgi:hypothetical protein